METFSDFLAEFMESLSAYAQITVPTSSAAQIIVAIIPIVAIVMGSMVIFFYLMWLHQRKMLSIKAGQYTKPDFNLFTFSLLTGLLLSTVGIAMTILLSLIVKEASYGLLGGVIPLAIGVGLLAFYTIKRLEKNA